VALIALTFLAYEVGPSARLDAHLLATLAAHHHTPLGTLAESLAHLADPLPLLVLLAAACGIAVWRGRPRRALAAVVVVAGANVTTELLKAALAHPRYQPVLNPEEVGYAAFPSGHATAAASIAIAYLFVVPARWRVLTALVGAGFVAAVGCSVVVLDWHFPSDVAGGILVACGWGFAVLAGLRAAGLPRESERRRGPPRYRGPVEATTPLPPSR
jgi:membrane-associated phospholipid phosphatase